MHPMCPPPKFPLNPPLPLCLEDMRATVLVKNNKSVFFLLHLYLMNINKIIYTLKNNYVWEPIIRKFYKTIKMFLTIFCRKFSYFG